MSVSPDEIERMLRRSNPGRPKRNITGTTSVNVPESVLDSVDSVLDALGLPELGPLLHRLAPRTVADALDVPTPDQLSDEMLRALDDRFDVRHPPER